MLIAIVTLFLFLEVSSLRGGLRVLGEILLERSGLTGKTRSFFREDYFAGFG
jgi:hypothetical protein